MGASSSRDTFPKNISKLLAEDIDPADQNFWDNLWKTNLSINEICQYITPDTVRKLIVDKPLNFQIIFTQAVGQLYQIVETPYPIYFEQALNCARILSRLLPFILETDSRFVKDMIWTRQRVLRSSSHDDATKENKADSSSHENKKPTHEDSNEVDVQSEPLAVILVNALFHLLFLPDFTIEDPNMEFNEDDLVTQEFKSAVMWAPGVGCREKTVANSSQYDKNRIDILRLMLTCFSEALYHNPDTYDPCSSLWLEVATSSDVPYAEIMFCSLINVVLGYDPVGWGLPYSNFVVADTAKPLMESSIHVLIALLDYGYPIQTSNSSESESSVAPSPSNVVYVDARNVHAPGFNIFRKLLHDISNNHQLHFIFRGFSRLLNNVHLSQSTYLPYSVPAINVEQELIVLLWKCLEEIPKFMPYVLRYCDVTELLVPLCYFMVEGRRDPRKLGIIYLCTFTLLKLSGERNFGVSLNKAYELHLPVDMPLFTGNHADLIVVVLHKLIVNGIDKLSPLYNCFLTIICNISPYCKSLCGVASVKLVNLLQLFTSPKFLYSSQSNHLYVTLLLETFNNMVQYQYEGNMHLIYAIVRRREIFEKLFGLTLPLAIKSALDMNDKEMQKKKNAAAITTAGVSGGSTNTSSGDKLASTVSSHGETVSGNSLPTDLVSTVLVERNIHNIREGEGEGEVEGGGDTNTSAASNEIKDTEGGEESNVIVKSDSLPVIESTSDTVVGNADEGDNIPITNPNTEDGDETTTECKSGEPPGRQGGVQVQPPEQDQEQVARRSHGSSHANAHAMDIHQRFVPTQAWLDAVKAEMPLITMNRLLKYLIPQIEEFTTSGRHGIPDENQILDFIKRTTMVGLLPQPPIIVIRKYQPNKFTSLWFTGFMWGVIFIHNQGISLFDGKAVKLFMVQMDLS